MKERNYDALDRLTAVMHDGQTIGTYSYDGGDQRIKKTEWNEYSQRFETIIYVNAFGRVYYERNITTNTDIFYVYGLTGRIAKKSGEELMYYHTDHLGTTHLLTDSSGIPVTAVDYEPFGDSDLSGEGERYLYTGQEIDASGLYYYKTRYYDVETGRFLSRDRWTGDHRSPQTLNKYVYCVNNPLKYSDPTGLSASFLDEEINKILNTTSKDPTSNESEEGYTPEEMGELAGYAAIGNPGGAPNGYHDHAIRELARQIYPDDEKSQNEFLIGYKSGWEKGEKDIKANKYDYSKSPLYNEVSDLLMTCLEIVASSYPTDIPLAQLAELDAALTVLETYKMMYDAQEEADEILNKGDQSQEKGSCLGTSILLLFLFFIIFSRRDFYET
jgi:RHS repeat-associated protein